MRLSLEALLVSTEIRFGFLVVPIARAAYERGDSALGDVVRARGAAACCRAHRLFVQVSHHEQHQLRGDLEHLQQALDQMKQGTRGSTISEPLPLPASVPRIAE